MTPETALPGTTSGDRRRAAQSHAGPIRVWDPDGPSTSAIAPALWDALHESVLWTQAEWAQAIEHASSADEVSALLGQLSQSIRAHASDDQGEWAAAPRTPLSRQLLGMIRGAFLERAQGLGGVDSGQLIRVLQAIEVVGRGL